MERNMAIIQRESVEERERKKRKWSRSVVSDSFRQEYWSGVPFPSPGNLPNPGIKPMSSALAGRFFTSEPPGKPLWSYINIFNVINNAKYYRHNNSKMSDLLIKVSALLFLMGSHNFWATSQRWNNILKKTFPKQRKWFIPNWWRIKLFKK